MKSCTRLSSLERGDRGHLGEHVGVPLDGGLRRVGELKEAHAEGARALALVAGPDDRAGASTPMPSPRAK